jgi:hypothetical protein
MGRVPDALERLLNGTDLTWSLGIWIGRLVLS